jgi:hypothetical protein
MALITEDLEIPPVQQLMPTTRRWKHVRPCGTPAAARRHLRQRGTVKVCETCARSESARLKAWYRKRIDAGWRNSGGKWTPPPPSSEKVEDQVE